MLTPVYVYTNPAQTPACCKSRQSSQEKNMCAGDDNIHRTETKCLFHITHISITNQNGHLQTGKTFPQLCKILERTTKSFSYLKEGLIRLMATVLLQRMSVYNK